MDEFIRDMKTLQILEFLSQLKQNNNREWFQLHKGEYEQARQDMIWLTQKLIDGISQFDGAVSGLEPGKCIFRIYRDVRFSANKEPYKTNMGAYMVPGGKKSGMAGYYLHLEPGNLFLAGGAHMPEPAGLKAIRDEVYYSTPEFLKILNDSSFLRYFSGISGESLKRPPKGYDANFEQIDLLKYKSYTLLYPLNDKWLSDSDLIAKSLSVFEAMLPFNQFLNKALGV